MYLLCYSI